MMNRPTEFFAEDEFAYWYVALVAADGTPIDADSTPTLMYRRDNGTGTTTTGVAVTKVAATTGLYQFRHNTALDGLLTVNSSIHYVETAIIGGVTYTNYWTTIVRGVATLAAQTSIKAKTDQLTFTVANQVDANSLTGGTSPSAVADAVWDEALSAHQSAGSTGKGLTDAAATGGDATLANQGTIIARLSASSSVYLNPTQPNKLTIVRQDSYTGTEPDGGALSWDTGRDTTGAVCRFTVRSAADAILIDQTTGGVTTGVSGTSATVSITSAASALLTVAENNKFDVELYWDADHRYTFARGICEVLEDQTRV
jgi:hypothetical protein